MLDPELLDILACPEDKQELKYNKGKTALVCVKCKRRYSIKGDIPVFVEEKKE
jgi:uncharacterized protein YbaR (Trm112 family)